MNEQMCIKQIYHPLTEIMQFILCLDISICKHIVPLGGQREHNIILNSREYLNHYGECLPVQRQNK